MKLIGVAAILSLIVGVSASPVDDLNNATRTFAAKLYMELIRNPQNQNVIFSPLAIQILMALFLSASRNENREAIQEIRNALNLPCGENNRQAAFRQVLEGLNHADNDFKVFLATKMYFRYGYQVENWYQNIAKNVYGSKIATVNFSDNRSNFQNINLWVAKKTNSRITNLIDEIDNDLSENIENVMINTLYLLGIWHRPFDQHYSTVKTFENLNGSTLVTMMNAEHYYDYFEDNNAQYLKMDLLRNGGGAYMIFVLPHKRIRLSQLETKVYTLLEDKAFEYRIVNVVLPKFSIRSGIKLKPVLQNLGMRQVFDVGTILEGLHYPGNPWSTISDLWNDKAFIEVDEWGVNAVRRGSVGHTYVDVGEPIGDKKNFIADRPFLFYITVDDAVIFAGRVMQV